MARVSSTDVQGILAGGRDYDTLNNPDLSGYITWANLLTNRVSAFSNAEQDSPLSSEELTAIEGWLAAHAYKMSDQQFTNKSTLSASAGFGGQRGMRLEMTTYGQQAMLLDSSGYLTAANNQAFAGTTWLGKPPSEQIDYQDRD